MHYQHYISHLTNAQIPDNQWLVDALSSSELENFFSRIKVLPISGCWEFYIRPCKRSTTTRRILDMNLSYASFKLGNRYEAAHRISYVLFHHPIPRGKVLVVDHLCEYKLCVNPHHLELVTERTNILRAYEKKRTRAHAGIDVSMSGADWTVALLHPPWRNGSYITVEQEFIP